VHGQHLRCKILYKKASLAALSDEANAFLFNESERLAIADHIPWTRVVAERRTEFRGETVDLIPHALAHRDRLVLKPNDEYGGKGIVLGWTVDDATWERSVTPLWPSRSCAGARPAAARGLPRLRERHPALHRA